MLSEVTAEQIDDSFNLQMVDDVCVKGKSEAIKIYTFIESKELSELSFLARSAYLEKNWPLAKEYWLKVLSLSPNNSIAPLYLQRIKTYQKSPPDNDWNGVTVLTSK